MNDLQDLFVLNALDKEVSVKAFGNWFTFKPKQFKRMRGEIGQFLDSNKGYMGLVLIPDAFEDPSFAASEEGQKILEEKTIEGVNRRAQHLQGIVNNLQISLRQDMDNSDMKAPIETQATDGELAAMDELLGYQRKQADRNKERSEAARVRLRQLASAQNAAVNQKKD